MKHDRDRRERGGEAGEEENDHEDEPHVIRFPDRRDGIRDQRSLRVTARAAGDDLSAYFHDYDWADEVLHAQIGRRMLRRDGITSEQASERAQAVHERTWAALEQYKSLGDQRNWWPQFVRRVLGHESAMPEHPSAGPPRILAE